MKGKCITQKGEGEIYTESSNSCVVYIREKKFFNGCINVQAAISTVLVRSFAEIYLCDRRVDR